MYTPFAFYQPEAAGPGYVTTDLTFYIDAGVAASYPGSGTTWSDLSANGYDLTITGTPTYSGTSPEYLQFGANDYATNYLDPTGLITRGTDAKFTIVCVFNQASLAADQRLFHAWGTTNTTNQMVNILLTTNNRFFFASRSTSGANFKFSNNNSWTNSTWTYYVLTVNCTTAELKFYNNNSLLQTIAMTPGDVNYETGTTTGRLIGVLDPFASHATGLQLGAVMVYDKILDATEMTTNYNYFDARYSF